MSSWSQRRKSLYALVALVIAVGAIGVPGFVLFYKAPTCSDGIMNGDEQGVDCGGSCQQLCQNSFISPTFSWTRFENVAPHLYNVAAYIINPNTDGEALNVPYHTILYDDKGSFIVDVPGTVTIPPHRNTIAFQGVINVGNRTPAKALFEFTAVPQWHKKKDNLAAISVSDKKYAEDELGSSLMVTLKNTSVYDIPAIAVYAVLYNGDGNAIGFSKTMVDGIPARGTSLAPFTWPVRRQDAVVSIEVLPVQE